MDLLGEQAVRLEQGDFGRVTLRRDPFELVERFAAAGAELVHVVDLDGARSGRLRPQLFARLAGAAAPARVQASGGIRSIADAQRLLAAGAERVVVGTAAFADEDALVRFASALGDRLVVALDARGGRIAVWGWQREAGTSVEEAAQRCAEAGVARILCTAIERDGTMSGPDLDLLARVRNHSGLPLLAAGGISSVAELRALARIGCEAAVIGRALLEGALSLVRPDRARAPTGSRTWAFARALA